MWPSFLLPGAALLLIAALPQAALADNSSSSSPAPSAPAPIDCAARTDGFYARGCSGTFDACSAGRAITMNCPADLVYDESRQQCEYPGNVVACGGEAPEETTAGGSVVEEGSGEGSGDLEGSGTEGSGEIEDVTGMCANRTDGFYRLAACGESFLGCSGGVAWRMACPASLKYDEQNQVCDYPGNVEGCSEGSGEDEEDVGGSDEGSGTDGSGTEGSGTEEGSGTDGSGIDGSGIDGSGTDGSGTEEEGSGNDAESDVTVEEKQIETDEIIVTAGKDSRRKQQNVDVKEIDTEDDIIHESSNGVVVENKEQKEIITEDIDDNSDASEEDEKLEQEELKEIEAEDDLIEEKQPEEQEAAVEDVVDENGEETGADGAAPSTTTTSSSTSTTTTAAPETQQDDAPPTCEGRGDGFFALGCASEMLACSNGIAHIMPCPAGLVFDERNQMCDYPAHVAACSARDEMLSDDSLLTGNDETAAQQPRPEIPRTRDSEPAPDATVAPTTPVGVTAAPTVAATVAATAAGYEKTATGPRKNRRDARCKSSDGLFSLGCSTEFVSCRAGVATKLDCAEGEAFEENGQSCVALASHPLCFAHARRPAAPLDEDVQMEKEADNGDDLQKPIDHSFACDFEGARAEEPCSDWFRLCEAGRGIEMYCLQGYLFDGEAAKCVPAGQLAHCQAQ